jgi:hypothetical protein
MLVKSYSGRISSSSTNAGLGAVQFSEPEKLAKSSSTGIFQVFKVVEQL